jgi:hypothetical protein
MTDKQLNRLLEIKEEVLTQSNLRYFSNIETSRKFSNGFFGSITKNNLIEIVKRFESEKPQQKLYRVDFDPMYPVPSVLIVLAQDEAEALRIASDKILHTTVKSVEEITMDQPKIVMYESGD